MAKPAKKKTKKAGRRRQPKRRTGVKIVDATIEAAERILSEEGPDRLTTEHLAKVSGVSVGSIYQYFESKQAVVGELARRVEQRALGILAERMQKALGKPFTEVVPLLIGGLIDGDLGDLKMRRALLTQIPRGWIHEDSEQLDSQTELALQGLLAAHGDAVRPGDRKLMTFVALHAVEAVIEAAVLRRPELLEDPAFRAELNHLVVSYLRADG